MGDVFGDLHIIVMVVVFIYLTGRIQKAGVRSRSMAWVVSAFVVFFLFYQYPWFALVGFICLFGYYFFLGLSDGYAEGQLMRHYVDAFKNPNIHTQHLISPMGPNTGWFTGGSGGQPGGHGGGHP